MTPADEGIEAARQDDRRMTLITIESRHYTWRAAHSERAEAERLIIKFWNERADRVASIAELEQIAEVEIIEIFDGFTEQR